VEQGLPRLRQALTDAGVNLSQLDVRQEHRQPADQERAAADRLIGTMRSTIHEDEDTTPLVGHRQRDPGGGRFYVTA
ncbi:MAG: hypothetical protein AAF513_13145, partial [Pseudomonadota bacterium]